MHSFNPGQRVAVLLPLPLPGPLDYQVDEGQSLPLGGFVRVPLGTRLLIGVVWGAAADRREQFACRPVNELLPLPPLPAISRQLVDWVGHYCLARSGAVLKMVMSVPSALEAVRPRPPHLRAAEPLPSALVLTAARQSALAQAQLATSAAELCRRAGVSPSVVAGLVRAGALLPVADGGVEPAPAPDPMRPGPVLSPEQSAAADSLRRKLTGGFSVTLLEGVTGSGKTEVYFEAIAGALAAGRQALVLLPEIALSAQFLSRFARRFGAAPLVWHSEVTQSARRRTWRMVAEGAASVVVGARSALFLPFDRLGLVVVDEEHDASYKQDEGVCYHARDIAVVRARLGAIPIVLASATPSLESLVNVADGRYAHLALPNRHGGASLPSVALIDLRRHPPPRQRWISPPLQDAVRDCLNAGEQALLFLNRRGYAPLTLCGGCGFRLNCPDCAAWLVDHRQQDRLLCHHCGHAILRPQLCPSCQAEGRFTPCGPGVERVAEEAALLFPKARLAVMASDLLTGPGAAAALVARMAAHDIDLLIGTQIVAKGHHFPLLTLVGVIDADLGLAGGDLRAGERTFQLLSQVAGRAGRADHPGRVLLQTYQPDAPVMQALAGGDAAGFIRAETDDRRSGCWPPFGRLVALIVSGKDPVLVESSAALMARQAPHDPAIELLGPAPAPFALLRGRHRHRLLLKAGKQVNLQAYLRRWLASVKLPRQVRVQVDVDPYSFL